MGILRIVVHCRKILVSRYNDHVPRCREVRAAGQSRSSVIGQLVGNLLGVRGVLWVVCQGWVRVSDTPCLLCVG